MKNRCTITLTLAVLSLTACANIGKYEPVVDMKRVKPSAYAQDLTECRAVALKAQNDEIAVGIMMGLLGAAAGASMADYHGGNAGRGAAIGAGAGFAAGAGAANVDHVTRQLSIVDNCLKGRGYRVLGR